MYVAVCSADVCGGIIGCTKSRIKHTCTCVQEEDRSHLRSSAPVREDQVSRNSILESFTFRVFVQQGRNPTIFRVSRVSLDSINRLVNTKKTHVILERNLQFLRK
jgi:hypothetical protein